MSKPVVGFAWLLILAALVFAAVGTAFADATEPTPTSPPTPVPPTQTLPFPTATATWNPYPYPIQDLSAAEQPQNGDSAAATAFVVTMEADMTFSSGSQPQSQATQEDGGFPLWPVILVLGLGLVLVLGIVGYFVLVRR
jgi:hypothetical protein